MTLLVHFFLHEWKLFSLLNYLLPKLFDFHWMCNWKKPTHFNEDVNFGWTSHLLTIFIVNEQYHMEGFVMALPHSFIKNDGNKNNVKEKHKTQKINYKWLVAWWRNYSRNIDWKCKPFFLELFKFFFLRNQEKKCKISEPKLTPIWCKTELIWKKQIDYFHIIFQIIIKMTMSHSLGSLLIYQNRTLLWRYFTIYWLSPKMFVQPIVKFIAKENR